MLKGPTPSYIYIIAVAH